MSFHTQSGKRGIGSVIHNEFSSYTDEYTGARIERLTDPGITCHHMYFYAHMTTADGTKLLYSPEIDGVRQIFCMDLRTGDAVQLTEGPGVDDWGAEFTSDERGVLYHQGQTIYRLDLATLERTPIYTTPDGWSGRDIGVSRDADALTLVEINEATMPNKIGGKNWDFFRENCLAKPECRIRYINTATGEAQTVIDERCWLGHTQIRPHGPSTIMYCHEGPYDVIDARIWLVNKDGSNERCARSQGEDIILTHEFWEPSGEKLAFVYREMGGSGIEEIHEIDPVTLEERVVMPCQTFAHCICDRAGKLFVGDAQGDTTPIHLQKEEDIAARQASSEVLNDFLYLIDLEHRREIKLAYHGTSWSARWGTPQDAHPHPCFSEDGRYVIFVTDRFGHPSICRIDLEAFLAKRER